MGDDLPHGEIILADWNSLLPGLQTHIYKGGSLGSHLFVDILTDTTLEPGQAKRKWQLENNCSPWHFNLHHGISYSTIE